MGYDETEAIRNLVSKAGSIPGRSPRILSRRASLEEAEGCLSKIESTLVSESDALQRFASVDAAVKSLRPADPMHCIHPQAIRDSAATFVSGFPGKVFYAVKVNPSPRVLREINAGGVANFDVASLSEVALARGMFPKARLAYTNPIKSRESIKSAYFNYGVRDFAVDTFEELHKILEETSIAKDAMASDLSILVRLAMPKGSATHDLSGKFGADAEASAQLLRDADKVAAKVGICFHVGSQCMDPISYTEALARVSDVIKLSGVQLDILNVGGGFPVAYPDVVPPPLSEYFAAISAGVKKMKLPKTCEVWGEPGRALATPAETLVVRVELRKGDALYINDGGYGSLFDGMLLGQRWPVRLIRPDRASRSKKLVPYKFYGPTCDSMDCIKGPFLLPDDVNEGDWIAIGQQGAYCSAIRTNFNGFYSDLNVEIMDRGYLGAPRFSGSVNK
ncbi:MAG: type III PLP-dependent enzyme [Alphaproteobacteria bacterium]|nr:type III PLP-dependent enzyme [Alphaproteobacteria bacterium]